MNLFFRQTNKIAGKSIVHLMIITLIIAFGILLRVLFFKSIGKSIEVSDSPTYLDCAISMYYHLGLSEYRPPVYPLGIMLMGIKYGWANVSLTMPYLQSFIGLVNVLFIYLTVKEAFKNRILAYIVSFIIAVNLNVYSWDLVILSENFSILLVTVIVYCVLLFFKRQQNKYLYFTLFLSFLAIYTKPFFLLLPFVILGLVILRYLILRDIEIKKLIKPLTISFLLIYSSILLYSAILNSQFGFFGFSSVGNVNYLGKVMQYNMGRYIPELENDIKTALNNEDPELIVDGKFPEPWNFVNKYGYRENHYEKAGKYATRIILTHPFEFVAKGLRLTLTLLVKSPFKDYIAINALASSNNKSRLLLLIKELTGYLDNLFIVIFIACLEVLYLVFGAKKTVKEKMFQQIIIVTIILYHYVIAAFFSYGDYSRLLVPSYPLMYTVMIISPIRLINFFHSKIKLLLH